ncbi:MAG: polyprenyl synthetase family protein [SAR324 cluster bacterium]|uniref:Polyprenyl synthetase family protein n=1 Tax=SAR324 cluster bacterium TaxID=2024889 RepID=A0A7X9FTJ4_9DELT|nr:polyprenyl synthetase family protein [SAR324 cluster bacterium]
MLQQKIQEYQGIINEALHNSLELIEIVEPLRSTVSYALFPGAKRLRPILAMLFFKESGGTDLRAFAPIGAAIELLHCSSLVHDDLPAVDNDEMRRGRASCHKACGEASAIFAGDLMISLAALVVTRSNFEAGIKLKIIDVLMESFVQICNGQQYDVLTDDSRPSLFDISRLKTADLFGNSMAVAAIAAGMDEEFIAAARCAGQQLGLCFQMLDDFIDAFGTNEQRGREGSSDGKKEKKTFFSGLSFEAGKEEWDKTRRRLDKELEYLEIKGPPFPLTRAFISQFLSRVELKL